MGKIDGTSDMFLQGEHSKSVLKSFARQNAALVQSIADLGMCHGDMHCENVAVKDKKLILIDFGYTYQEGRFPMYDILQSMRVFFLNLTEYLEYVEENKCSKEFVWICDEGTVPNFVRCFNRIYLCFVHYYNKFKGKFLDNDFATKADQESLIDLGRKAMQTLRTKFHEKGLSPTKALELANEGYDMFHKVFMKYFDMYYDKVKET